MSSSLEAAAPAVTKHGGSKKLHHWFRSSAKQRESPSKPKGNEDTSQASLSETCLDSIVESASERSRTEAKEVQNYHQVLVDEEALRLSPLPNAQEKMTEMEQLVTAALDETARGYQWTVAAAGAQEQLAIALKTPLMGDEILEDVENKPKKPSRPIRHVNIPRNSNDPVVLLSQQHHMLYDIVANAVPDTEQADDLHTAAVTEIHERWALAQELHKQLQGSEEKIQSRWGAYTFFYCAGSVANEDRSTVAYCSTVIQSLPQHTEAEGSSVSVSSAEDKWFVELEYRNAIENQKDIMRKLDTVLQQMAGSETRRSERLRKHLEEELLKQQGKAFHELGKIHATVRESLVAMGQETKITKKERVQQVAESFGATAVFPKPSKTTAIPLNQDIALDPSSEEYSKFMKQLLFSGSLLASHYVHFAAVAQVMQEEHPVSEDSGTVLVVVTCDRVLHVFDLEGVTVGTNAEDAFRSVLNQAEADAADRCAEIAPIYPDVYRETVSLDWSSYAITPSASIELKDCNVRPKTTGGVNVKARASATWAKYSMLCFNTHDEEEEFTQACNDGKEISILFI